jgi:hypothetical protein
MCKAVEIGKKGGYPDMPPWYWKSDLKKSCRLISTQKCHSKEYTYKHHCTKFYKLLPFIYARYFIIIQQ